MGSEMCIRDRVSNTEFVQRLIAFALVKPLEGLAEIVVPVSKLPHILGMLPTRARFIVEPTGARPVLMVEVEQIIGATQGVEKAPPSARFVDVVYIMCECGGAVGQTVAICRSTSRLSKRVEQITLNQGPTGRSRANRSGDQP